MGKGNVAADMFDKAAATVIANASPVSATETLEQKVARLEAELAKANAKTGFKVGTITMKIGDGHETTYNGEKKATKVGNVSLYGIQRRPVTLWFNQWQTLIEVLSGSKKIRLAGKDGEFTFAELMKAGVEAGVITTEKK